MKLISYQVSGVRFQQKQERRRYNLFFCLLITVLLIAGSAGAQQPAKIARIVTFQERAVLPIKGLMSKRCAISVTSRGKLCNRVSWRRGKPDRMPGFATELVQAKVDILVLTNFINGPCR
jgi:hypothetical protein